MTRQKFVKHLVVIAITAACYGCSDSGDDGNNATADAIPEAPGLTDNNADNNADENPDGGTDSNASGNMDFFLTSAGPGDGANLGGLAGADVHCNTLAEAVGTNAREWRAYLSTTGADGVNAIDRIGQGPWANANGVIVADSPENLLSDQNNLTRETAINESGEVVNGAGDTPNRHDILTGTGLDGLASTDTTIDTTCANWTSNGQGSATVGHHDRIGGGANSTSWSSAHPSSGCSQSNLQATGGDGLFYCFAIN